MSEMMICKLGHTIPLSSPICDDRCSDYHLRRGKCINLIPYIPEQPTTCPECGHLWSEHGKDGGCTQRDACACKLLPPADLQPEPCSGCPDPEQNYNCPSKADCPEPEMPLPVEKSNELLDLMCKGNMEGLEPTEVTKLISLWYQWYVGQQQAHDSAVASKARQFLVAKIIGRYADTLSPEAIRDIRAMAEGEE